MPRRQIARRRCSECRRWYLPSAQTAHNQKTCGRESCQRRRRARLERHRREESLAESRLAERERRRESRRRRREAGPCAHLWRPSDGASTECGTEASEGLSLADLKPELAEMMQKALDNWDTVFEQAGPLSLAGLKFQLFEILEKGGHFVGQAGSKKPGCPWPAEFCNHLEPRGKPATFWDKVSLTGTEHRR